MAKRKSVKKARGTKASRSAAAKKAARTRKANAAKRSRSAKKAAATRKRNAGKRKSSAKKAAATRRRKSPKRKTKRKAAKRTRGPSKAKRSAAAKKGWRTRKAAKTKRSNAAKRAARTRKGKTTRRKTKRKAAPKRRKSGRMTKAKRSAAAKKGWRTRRRGGYKAKGKKATRRKTKRKAYRRTAKLANVNMGDAVPTKLSPFAGLTAGASAMVDSFTDPGKQFAGLMTASKYALAGMSMMGVLAVAKGEVWDRVGLTAAVDGAVGGIDIVGPDLVNAFDAMLDLATLGALGIALNKGLGIGKGWIGPGMTAASIIVAADFVRNINLGGFGDKASAGAADIRNVMPTSLSNITGMFSGMSGIGLGGNGSPNMTGPMFGTHNIAGGPSVGNNLALAMSPNNTAATGNTHFFGTKSLGSTRVNLF